jgi:hypothetical protein
MSLDVWIEQFYQPSDADDWSNAYRRALSYWVGYTNEAGFGGDARGFTLRFMAKEYNFKDSIDVVRGMHLVGSGGSNFPSGTRLLFPYGVDGIIIHSAINLNPSGRSATDIVLTGHDLDIFNRRLALATTNVPLGLNSLRGAGTVIERLSLHSLSAGIGVGLKEAHGIAVRTVCVLRDIYINNFSGNGIDIRAWTPTWNANGWQVQNCLIQNCQDGFYCWGSDVNAGCATAVNFTGNRGGGIWDASFLGNTYIACHSDSNTEGSYRTGTARDGSLRGTSGNLFLGCYSEGNTWPGGRVAIKAPSVVVGGSIGPTQHWRDMGISDAQIENDPVARSTFEEFRSTATMLFTNGYGGLFPNGGVTGESAPNHLLNPKLGRNRAYARIGSDIKPTISFEFGLLQVVEPDQVMKLGTYQLTYQFKPRPEEVGWWSFSAGEGDEIGSPLRLSTSESPENRGQIWFQNGFFVGGGNALFAISENRPRIRVVTGIAAPDKGLWHVGDRVFNAEPTAGGWSGWVCVTSGDPGVWKGFGLIES